MATPDRPAVHGVVDGGRAGSSARPTGRSIGEPLVIDCATCIGPSVGACEDCVVTFLCDREPDDAVVIDVNEARALRLLADADLVPRLRHSSVTKGA